MEARLHMFIKKMTSRFQEKYSMRLAYTVSLSSVLAGISVSASAQSLDRADLDFRKTVNEDSVFFVPIAGGNTGVTWFSEYIQDIRVGQPNPVTGLRFVSVRLVPEAVSDGVTYENFLANNDLASKDRRVNLFDPEDLQCGASSQLIQFLSENSGGTIRPSVSLAGFPALCQMNFLADDSWLEIIDGILEGGGGWEFSARIPLCALDSPRVSIQDVVGTLEQQGIVTATDNGNQVFEGSFVVTLNALYELVGPQLTSRVVELFGPQNCDELAKCRIRMPAVAPDIVDCVPAHVPIQIVE